jgi:SAM-dependent methyltransferase
MALSRGRRLFCLLANGHVTATLRVDNLVPDSVRLDDVRAYWEAHPLCAEAIPHALGSPEYFEFYDRLREANESVEFSARLHEYARFNGKRVLDVGCGNGYVLSRYAQAGAMTTGVDLTDAAVDLCRRRFEYLGLEGEFRQANAEALPFSDETFDCVTSMGVLHHTPDTAAAVAEVFRVLKPGGRLIVMFYHRNSALYRVGFPLQRLLTGKSMQQLVNEVDGLGNPLGDVYSDAELRRLLAAFCGVELFAGLLEPWMVLPRFSRALPRQWLKRFARRWGWFLYAKGWKPGKA